MFCPSFFSRVHLTLLAPPWCRVFLRADAFLLSLSFSLSPCACLSLSLSFELLRPPHPPKASAAAAAAAVLPVRPRLASLTPFLAVAHARRDRRGRTRIYFVDTHSIQDRIAASMRALSSLLVFLSLYPVMGGACSLRHACAADFASPPLILSFVALHRYRAWRERESSSKGDKRKAESEEKTSSSGLGDFLLYVLLLLCSIPSFFFKFLRATAQKGESRSVQLSICSVFLASPRASLCADCFLRFFSRFVFVFFSLLLLQSPGLRHSSLAPSLLPPSQVRERDTHTWPSPLLFLISLSVLDFDSLRVVHTMCSRCRSVVAEDNH